FFPSRGSDLHLLASLNLDGFHPLGMKPSGSKYTSTGMFMALLSLPEDIRFKIESLFLATIICGPEAPSNEQLNFVLSPLMDEAIKLWIGVHYSTTALRSTGRIVRLAVPCLLCDLVAALPAAGFGHFSSNAHPCAFCKIDGPRMKEGAMDGALRTRDEVQRLGRAWKDLRSRAARLSHFQRYGVRYTELSRLSYFNVVRCKVLDLMHTMQGVWERHIADLLGLEPSQPDATAEEMDVRNSTTTADLFDAEMTLFKPPQARPAPRQPLKTPAHFLGGETCRLLWDINKSMTLPSWTRPLPANVGTKEHRKLSAGQWATLGSIHLPVTLVPLWQSKGGVFLDHLEAYMLLVYAVHIATAKTVSQNSIHLYEDLIRQYIDRICDLFPHANITPKQHGMTHLGPILEDFGPGQNLTVAPLERLIGDIQEITSN
ncbi:hypothetical protein DL93DRAFT_2047206, partial [Clavulina sp. PMI_390]